MFEGLDKSKLCLLLLYPIFDSYIKYIEPLKTSSHYSKISNFINDRIKFIKTLFSTPIQPIIQPIIQPKIHTRDQKMSMENIPSSFKNVALTYEILSNIIKSHKLI